MNPARFANVWFTEAADEHECDCGTPANDLTPSIGMEGR